MVKSLGDIAVIIFEKHGYLGVTFIAILALLCYFTVELIKYSFKTRFVQTKVLKKKKGEDLKKHLVFKTLQDLIKYKIDALHFECAMRKAIFKKILKTKYQIMHDGLLELTKEDWDVSNAELRMRWDSFFASVQHKWVTECKNDGVPSIAINKFIDTSKDMDNIIKDTVEDICLNDPFSGINNATAVFSLIPTMEVSALTSLNKALIGLNGELSNQMYQGVGCETCDEGCEAKKVQNIA